MDKGIYIALSGAVRNQKNMDIYAQNVANASTHGYKKERISFKEYLMPVENKLPSDVDGKGGTNTSLTVTDFSSGILQRTGNPLDLALDGEGFFALEGERYTRNGSFKIDKEGYLATQDDIKLLGSGGPIAVQGKKVDVNTLGEVFVDNVSVGQVKLVDFSDKTNLKRLSGGTFTTREPAQEAKAMVSQGYLETSNVDVMREIVQMMTSLREFESFQKVIQTFDEAASKEVNELGR